MRGTPNDAALRGALNLTRGVVVSTNDGNYVQTVTVRLMANEMAVNAERFTAYGFHSVPPPADNNGQNGAEVAVGFMDGNRSHAVILADIDRRTKPKNWKPGDAGNWHYKGATAKWTDDAFTHDQGPEKTPHNLIVGNTTVQAADGQHTTTVGNTSVTKTSDRIVTQTAAKIFTGAVHIGVG